MNELDQRKTNGAGVSGRWTLDGSEMASAFKFLDQSGMLSASRLAPETVFEVLGAELKATETIGIGAAHGG